MALAWRKTRQDLASTQEHTVLVASDAFLDFCISFHQEIVTKSRGAFLVSPSIKLKPTWPHFVIFLLKIGGKHDEPAHKYAYLLQH